MIFKKDKIYNFMGIRKISLTFSLTLILISLFSMATNGIRYGLDFSGGTLIEVGYEQSADLEKIRASLEAGGFKGAVVQHFGSDREVLIRMQEAESPAEAQPSSALDVSVAGEEAAPAKLSDRVLAVLKAEGAAVDLRRIEFVGPQVGDQMKSQGFFAVVISLLVVMVYLAFRFQMKFSIAAIGALIHDVIITLGAFAFFGWEFDLTVLAALLAVIGYSLNDTIVVFDRIREDLIKVRQTEIVEVINAAVSETLSRTIMTSFTTLITLFSLLLVGGDALRGFSTALIIGVGIGTYSSIYIAATLLPLMKVTRLDLMPPEKAQEEYDTP